MLKSIQHKNYNSTTLASYLFSLYNANKHDFDIAKLINNVGRKRLDDYLKVEPINKRNPQEEVRKKRIETVKAILNTINPSLYMEGKLDELPKEIFIDENLENCESASGVRALLLLKEKIYKIMQHGYDRTIRDDEEFAELMERGTDAKLYPPFSLLLRQEVLKNWDDFKMAFFILGKDYTRSD